MSSISSESPRPTFSSTSECSPSPVGSPKQSFNYVCIWPGCEAEFVFWEDVSAHFEEDHLTMIPECPEKLILKKALEAANQTKPEAERSTMTFNKAVQLYMSKHDSHQKTCEVISNGQQTIDNYKGVVINLNGTLIAMTPELQLKMRIWLEVHGFIKPVNPPLSTKKNGDKMEMVENIYVDSKPPKMHCLQVTMFGAQTLARKMAFKPGTPCKACVSRHRFNLKEWKRLTKLKQKREAMLKAENEKAGGSSGEPSEMPGPSSEPSSSTGSSQEPSPFSGSSADSAN